MVLHMSTFGLLLTNTMCVPINTVDIMTKILKAAR